MPTHKSSLSSTSKQLVAYFESLYINSSNSDAHEDRKEEKTKFDIHVDITKLSMNFPSYLRRLCSAFSNEDRESTLGLARVYIDRISNRIRIGEKNAHKLSAICILLADKFLHDCCYTNDQWASACGIPLEELNQMEIEALILLDWELNCDPDCFAQTQEAFYAACEYVANDYSYESESSSAGVRYLRGSQYQSRSRNCCQHVTFDRNTYESKKWSFADEGEANTADPAWEYDTETDDDDDNDENLSNSRVHVKNPSINIMRPRNCTSSGLRMRSISMPNLSHESTTIA